MAWFTALRMRCSSGPAISSITVRSTSVSWPSNTNSNSLCCLRATARGAIQSRDHGRQRHQARLHQAVLEGCVQAIFTAEDTFTIPDDGIHFIAQGRHIRNALAQAASKLVELCITVQFQLVKFGKVGGFYTAIGVLCANVTIGISLARHHLHRAPAGQGSRLEATLQFLTHIA